ncbi:MAG: hypothetical protein IKD09_00585 [Lentisphaeria bacterium]|nr:hypothetical protein [Lentisphaeria bacterium]
MEEKLLQKIISFFKCFGVKTPVIKKNTFIVWEPCSKSHAEVVPGYVKYLLDLGYHVSVLVNVERYWEGLFDRYAKNDNISLNFMSKRNIRKFFKTNDLSSVKGVLVTTVGKLCKDTDLESAYTHFAKGVDRKKLFFVEHDAKIAIDENRWCDKVITLRKLNYRNAESIVVNPHYFGKVEVRGKNSDVVNFVTVGAINPKRKNSTMIIDAVKSLHDKGIENFRVTVIGKGKLKDLPDDLRKYFDIKGRLDFRDMYSELEKADFMLTAYDDENPLHQRYNTVGTSGNFQLVYGFLLPCVIIKSFAELNGFNSENSIIYEGVSSYASAMEEAINISSSDYTKLQNNLQTYVKSLFDSSLKNLQEAING